MPGVLDVSDPLKARTVAADLRIGYADVRFRRQASDVPQTSKDALDRAMAQARHAGLTVEFGGSAMDAKTEVGGPADVGGVVVAFTVLALALGSLMAAGLPLLTALVGVAIGVLGVQFVLPLGRDDQHCHRARPDDRSGRGHRLRPVHHLPPSRATRRPRPGRAGLDRACRGHGRRRGRPAPVQPYRWSGQR